MIKDRRENPLSWINYLSYQGLVVSPQGVFGVIRRVSREKTVMRVRELGDAPAKENRPGRTDLRKLHP